MANPDRFRIATAWKSSEKFLYANLTCPSAAVFCIYGALHRAGRPLTAQKIMSVTGLSEHVHGVLGYMEEEGFVIRSER